MILFHLSSLIVSAVEYRPLLHVTGEIIQRNGIKLMPLLRGIGKGIFLYFDLVPLLDR